MELNQKIKDLRLKKGLTLEQVGNYVGVGKSTVRKWENDMIKNMRRDKIARLAEILGTTPDYLIGGSCNKDNWSSAFCKSLSQELMMINHTDAMNAGIDIERLESVASREVPISLLEACNIADEIGASLDYMVGISKVDSKTFEFIKLFSQLTTEQQSIIISQIKDILANQDQPKKTYAIKKAARHGNFEKKTITDTELDEIKCLHDVNDLK